MKNQKNRLLFLSFLLVLFVHEGVGAAVTARIMGAQKAVAGQWSVYSIDIYDPNNPDKQYFITSCDWSTAGIIDGTNSVVSVKWDLPGKYVLMAQCYLVFGGPVYASIEVEVTKPKEPDPNLPNIEILTSEIYQLEEVQVKLNTKNFNIENIVWSGSDIIVKSGQGTSNPIVIFSKFGINRIQASFNFISSSKVEVTADYPEVEPFRNPIVGPNEVCNEATYSIEGLPENSKITWSLPSSGPNKKFVIVSGGNTNNVKIRVQPSLWGEEVLKAQIEYNSQIIEKTKNIYALTGNMEYVFGPSTAQVNQNIIFEASPAYPNDVCGYSWVVTPSFGVTQTPRRYLNTVRFRDPGTYRVICRLINTPCGTPGTSAETTVVVGQYYNISSIASTGIVDIHLSDLNQYISMDDRKRNDIEYEIYSQKDGRLVSKGLLSYLGGRLDLSTQMNGIYIIRVESGEGTYESHKVVINIK